jgi:NADH-quinone oxidoreductase subunit C
VLARRDRALTPEETEALLRSRLGDGVVGSTIEHGTFTIHVAQDAWVEAVTRCRDEGLLAYDLFDSLFGTDAGDDGFDVVAVLYSTSTGNRLCLRTRCAGGREAPSCPSVTGVYRGADWMERETWDMFGIDFPGHPGLAPRILTVENFEGWPLRKDFPLTSRIVKPWPGVKEPAELDEEGNVVERETGVGDAPGPYELDRVMAEQAIARRAGIEARAARAAERASEAAGVAEEGAPSAPEGAPSAPEGDEEGAS